MGVPSARRWWHSAVIYQIYPRSWADGNGDGIGDFAGMIDRLDYLVDTLPVDAVWLSPFYPSPQADFGYDVSDYTAVDPMYGTMEDFDRFLAAVHSRGLRLLVDFVPNHTSDRHPWFEESRSSATSPKRDWYVWADPAPDGGPPNNWLGAFGGSAWAFDEATGQYYLHSFLPEQADLNWRNPEVEAAMHGAMAFWLDRGVDGFRLDVPHRMMKDPKLRSNPPAAHIPEDGYKLVREWAAQDHLYDHSHPDIHGVFRRMRALVDTYEDRSPKFMIGEIHESDWRVWASYYGVNRDELHMPFNFALLHAGADPERIRRAIEWMEAVLPAGAWPNWVLGNHDEPRVATRLGPDESKTAAVLLLTLRGTPTLYYGDELGMPDLHVPADEQQDPWGRTMPGMGRDGCRTPMQWTGTENCGFSPPGSETWLPTHHEDTVSVEGQLGVDGSHLELHRSLLHLRRARPELRHGEIEFLSGWDPVNPLVYARTLGDRRSVVALNFSPDRVPVELDGAVLAGTSPGRVGSAPPDELEPWEAIVAG